MEIHWGKSKMFLKIIGWIIIIFCVFVIIGSIASIKEKNESKKVNIGFSVFFLILALVVGLPLAIHHSSKSASPASTSPKKVEKSKPKTAEQILESKIKKAAYPGYGKVTKVEINDYQGLPNNGKMVLVYIKEDALTKRIADMYTAKGFGNLFKIKDVKEVCYFWQATLVDSEGNKSLGTIEKVDMTKKKAANIDWKYFDYTTLNKVANSYYVHPSMK